MRILENISLANHTTYKVGGPAQYFIEPSSTEEIREAILWAQRRDIPFYIIGKGSNLVVSDSGFPGLILYLGRSMRSVEIQESQMVVEAGALLHKAVTESVTAGLSGIQHLCGIPGTMGGGVYINAGAFSQELNQTVTQVESITYDGEIKLRTNEECEFSYRHSKFFELDEIITRTWLSLQPRSPDELKQEFTETLKRRKAKQPLEYPNAGSMYKRPPGTYAGLLIENAKLKGFKIGGACISPKHSNFVINHDNCSAQDIYDLSEEVIRLVEKDSHITLEKEQIFIGEFQPWPRN
jgi:UDP-N-acetylmuramate dehydrogenase